MPTCRPVVVRGIADHLAAKLISSHASRDAAFDGFTHGLDREERAGLLTDLAQRARRPDSCAAAALLRALLHSRALRLPAAREAVRLMRADVLSGKSAVLCISELRIGVLRYWECRGGCNAQAPTIAADTALHARGPPVSAAAGEGGPRVEGAAQRLDELFILCEDLLSALLPTASGRSSNGSSNGGSSGGSTGGSTGGGSGSSSVSSSSSGSSSSALQTSGFPVSHRSTGWGDGCISAIQLLPTLLHAADAVAAELAAGRVHTLEHEQQAHRQSIRQCATESGGAPTDEGAPSAHLVSRLLTSQWDPRGVLPVLAALEDAALTSAQLAVLRTRLEELLSDCDKSSLALARPQLLGIAKHVLAHADRSSLTMSAHGAAGGSGAGGSGLGGGARSASHASSARRGGTGGGGGGGESAVGKFAHGTDGDGTGEAEAWCELLLLLASAIAPSELPELLWLVESSLRHSPSLHAALNAQMRSETARRMSGSKAASGSFSEVGSAAGCSAGGGGAGGGGGAREGSGARSNDCNGAAARGAGDDGVDVTALYERHKARLAVQLLLLQRSTQTPKLFDTLQAHIGSIAATISVATTAATSPGNVGPMSASGWAALQRLLRGLVCMPALSSRTEVRSAPPRRIACCPSLLQSFTLVHAYCSGLTVCHRFCSTYLTISASLRMIGLAQHLPQPLRRFDGRHRSQPEPPRTMRQPSRPSQMPTRQVVPVV